MDVAAIERYVIENLGRNLSPELHYHNLAHTLGVVSAAIHIANEESIRDSYNLDVLKTAALLHDCGFLNTVSEHEEEGCRIAIALLPEFGYKPEAIDLICKLIMKTKLPQLPETLLEKILCDADLNHLGRVDFKEVSQRLYDEMEALGKVTEDTNWNQIQLDFLLEHQFWTESAMKDRNALKIEQLKELQQLVKAS